MEMASTFPAIEQRTEQRRDWFDFAFFGDFSPFVSEFNFLFSSF